MYRKMSALAPPSRDGAFAACDDSVRPVSAPAQNTCNHERARTDKCVTRLSSPASISWGDEKASRLEQFRKLLDAGAEGELVEQLGQGRPRDLDAVREDSGGGGGGRTLLQRAARAGLARAATALVRAGADPNACSAVDADPPLVTAARLGHDAVLQALLRTDGGRALQVDAADALGDTALHHAARAGRARAVALLLHAGADAARRNRAGAVALRAAKLRELLDGCVRDNGKHAQDDDYEIHFDFAFVSPPCSRFCTCGFEETALSPREGSSSGRKDEESVSCVRPRNVGPLKREMSVLNMLYSSEQLREVLDHPIIVSFVKLKWHSLKMITYVELLFHVLFTIFMNGFLIHRTDIVSKNENSTGSKSYCTEKMCSWLMVNYVWIWGFLSLLFGIVLASRETLRFCLYRRYYKFYDNTMFIFTLICFTYVTVAFLKFYFNVIIPSVLSMMLLGMAVMRLSFFANTHHAADLLSRRYLSFLLTQSGGIIAFAYVFYVIYLSQKTENINEPEGLDMFSSISSSMMNSLLVMTGAIDVKTSSMWLKWLLFHVSLSAIMIFSIMTALAVGDVQKTLKTISIRCIGGRIIQLMDIERFSITIHNTLLRVSPVPHCVMVFMRRAIVFPVCSENRVYLLRPNTDKRFCASSGFSFPLPEEVLDRARMILSERHAAATNDVRLRTEKKLFLELEHNLAEKFKQLETNMKEFTLEAIRASVGDLRTKLNDILTVLDNFQYSDTHL